MAAAGSLCAPARDATRPGRPSGARTRAVVCRASSGPDHLPPSLAEFRKRLAATRAEVDALRLRVREQHDATVQKARAIADADAAFARELLEGAWRCAAGGRAARDGEATDATVVAKDEDVYS